MKRTFVIINEDENLVNIIQNNINILAKNKLVNEIYIATTVEKPEWNQTINDITTNNIVFPADCTNTPKKRNWLNKYFRTQQYDGILYVSEDEVKFETSPEIFFTKLENMMNILDYPVWFNTIADRCNYVYNKYVPRVSITIDKNEYSKFNLGRVIFTSHSNTALIAYDFNKVTDDQLTFNESFDIPMYYIIEFLARRRNTKVVGSLFFMNQYMTIPEEYGAFTTIVSNKKTDTSQDKMKEEDQMFRSMNINYASDNSIDQLLEQTYDKLQSKL